MIPTDSLLKHPVWCRLAAAAYFVALLAASVFAYLRPYYNLDMLSYIGNVVALQTTDAVKIHTAVYREVRTSIPPVAAQRLLGNEGSDARAHSNNRRDRANNPYHSAEFLPSFAIRPLYIELINLLNKSGVGLIRSTTIISSLSYFLLGALVFLWLSSFVGAALAAACALLLMISPPILSLARFNTPDCLSCLVLLGCAYLLLHKRALFPGLILLLAGVYVRTDNVLFVLLLLAYLWLVARVLDPAKALVLAAAAVASVLVINYFSGNYGLRLLYVESFSPSPLVAPGEVVPRFGFADYVRAFAAGAAELMNGYLLPFLLMGVTGMLAGSAKPVRHLFLLACLFVLAHFVLYPAGEERYYVLLYLSAGMLLASCCGPSWFNIRQPLQVKQTSTA